MVPYFTHAFQSKYANKNISYSRITTVIHIYRRVNTVYMENTSINPTTVRLAPVTKAKIENLVERGYAKNTSEFICKAVDHYIGKIEG